MIDLFFFLVLLLNHRAPGFKSLQQQDSQELLHYLLDAVRTEETKVRFPYAYPYTLYFILFYFLLLK